MKIVKMKIEKLIPSPYNPRKDLKKGDPEYKKLKKSIMEFDYIDPVIYNERTGRIVGGHQRLKVLQELGYTEIEVSEDIVLDTFLGSGTTLIAAEQLGRRCFGIELDPRYCDVVVARWERLTAQKAEPIYRHDD